MSAPELTQQDIETIIQIIKSATDVTEFSLKYGSTEIYLSRAQHSEPRSPHASRPASVDSGGTVGPPPAPPPAEAPKTEPLAANEFVIKAPMVGTFYRSPAPIEPPFVEVGASVEPGTILCIIEVMKLMSSIAADRAGTVKAVLVRDGEPVEFGQPLMVLQANE